MPDLARERHELDGDGGGADDRAEDGAAQQSSLAGRGQLNSGSEPEGSTGALRRVRSPPVPGRYAAPMRLLLLLVACGEPADTGVTAASPSWPQDSSAAGIVAFVEGGSWLEAPWVAETTAPRDAITTFSPHGRVQVHMNEVLIASLEEGNGGYEGAPHRTGSMAIKRLVDDDDREVGMAAMLKLEGDDQQWVYWCDGPADRCEGPYYGVAYDSSCVFCHGGQVFNDAP